MGQNNFKELDRLNIENRGDNKDKIKKNINSNISLLGFISNLIDLYLPKVGNVIQSSFDSTPSDSESRKPKKYPNK